MGVSHDHEIVSEIWNEIGREAENGFAQQRNRASEIAIDEAIEKVGAHGAELVNDHVAAPAQAWIVWAQKLAVWLE